jgi:hypothetical protein
MNSALKPILCAVALLGIVTNSEASDPRVSSWITNYAGRYARIYTTDANKTNGVTVTTWSNGSQTQSLPAYCGIQEIFSSTDWVYIRTTGLGNHIMGPWYDNAARTAVFVNMPTNQKLLFRIPKNPVVPATNAIAAGTLGFFADGVRMFDARDAVSYSTGSGRDGDPPGGQGLTGDGVWNRDAYVNEGITMDPALMHQQNAGTYHGHANPIATRYLLGDHVDFNTTTKMYTESAGTPTKHSPIVGWMHDGFPLYGPYGFSNATNAASGIRRMVSGYVQRNGLNGTINLAVTGRTSLPQWAARAANRSATLEETNYGPAVSASFPLGRYTEDNDYSGNLGKVQGVDFDLDEYNGRLCVTPEFPNGTYAYFVTLDSNGAPTYPYNAGRQFYGTPSGGTVQTIAETVTTNFIGGTNLALALQPPVRNGGTVTLSWSAHEGGTYKVESTANFSGWDQLATNVSPQRNVGAYTNTAPEPNKFYRVSRTALANFDSAGTTTFSVSSVAPGGSGARGTTVTVTITLPSSPPNPPVTALPTSVTLGTIAGSGFSRPSQSTVTATFTIPANATTGLQNIVVTFSPGPVYTLTGAFTIF